jgi:hypothetical protein
MSIENVRNYGAVGDGVTDDNPAIVLALAALTNNSVLYFPPGVYRCRTINIAGLTGIKVLGDGPGVSVIKNNSSFSVPSPYVPVGPNNPLNGAQVINITSSCSFVEVSGLTFDGNCDHRKPGQQAVIIDADHTHFHHNYTINSGEFANTFGRNRSSSDPMTDLHVHENEIGPCFADGINVHRTRNGIVSDNVITGADDDIIAISECEDVLVANNVCRCRTDVEYVGSGFTNWGRGIALLAGCNRVMVEGNLITKVKQTGLLVAAEGGVRPRQIQLANNLVANEVAINSGYGIRITDAENVTCNENSIDDIEANVAMLLGAFDKVAIKGGSIRNNGTGFLRAIAIDQSIATPSATVWDGLTIENVTIEMPNGGNEAMYLQPDNGSQAALRLKNLMIIGNTCNVDESNYIVYNQTETGSTNKIGNNTRLLPGGSIVHGFTPAVGPTAITFNNN